MIDPNNITDFNRTQEQLEEFWLFCILVAGKKSSEASKVLNRILKYTNKPFVFLKNLTDREREILLRRARSGQYNRINKAIKESLKLDLKNAHFFDLVQIKGVGPKTASFFLLHSRGEEHAVLDTHILKWLRSRGHDAPKTTPQKLSSYEALSNLFKKEVAISGEYDTFAEADLEIWKKYSTK